jgi:predicted ABC-type ATPase
LEQADRAWLYDNSGARPQLMGEKQAGTVILYGDALPEIIDATRRLQEGRL